MGILFTRDRHVVLANAMAADILRTTVAELVGKPASTLWPTEQAYLDLGRAVAPALAEGGRFAAELQVLRVDQTPCWCRVTAKSLNPVSDHDGTVWMIEDISERVAADQALRAAQARLSMTLRVVPDLFSVTHLRDGRLVMMNDGFQALTGWSREDALGHSTVELGIWVDPADRDQFVQSLRRDGSVENLEYDFRRRDASVFRGLISGRLFVVEGEDLIALVMRDVTQQRAQEAAVRQSQALYKAMLQAVPDYLTLSTVADGRLIAVNPGFERSTGWTSEEAIGKTSLELNVLSAADRQRAMEALRAGRGIATNFEMDVGRKDGTHWHGIASAATFSVDGVDYLLGIARDVSESKAQAAALSRSYDTLAKIQAIAGLGVWQWHPGADHLLWSQTMFDIFQLDNRSRVVTAPGFVGAVPNALFIDRIVEEDRTRYLEETRSILADRSFRSAHYRIVRTDGAVRHIRSEGSVELAEDGRVALVFGFLQDVTDRTHFEARLKRESTYMRAVLENMPQGTTVFDEQLKLKYWNSGFQKIIDLPVNVLHENASFIDLARFNAARGDYGPGDPEQQAQSRLQLALKFQPHSFERTLPNGMTCLINGQPMYLDDKIAGFVTTYTDITERKRAEQAILKLSLAVEQSAEGIVITNLDGQIEYVNEAYLRNSGYTRDELIGQNPRLLQSDKAESSVYQAMWAVLTQGQPWKGELCNRRKDGTEYFQFVHVSPIRQADGRVSHYVAFNEDITEKRRLGEELDLHRNKLEQLVQQRTQELRASHHALETTLGDLKVTQSQLVQSEKMASLGQLVASVAHEINTPIGAIKSSGQSIAVALDQALRELPTLLRDLDMADAQPFQALLSLLKRPSAYLSSREERATIRQLSEALEAMGVADARHVAGMLVQCRVLPDDLPTIAPLLHSARVGPMLDAAFNLAVVLNSAANINVAVEGVARIVFALKSFSRVGERAEPVMADLRENLDMVLTLYSNKFKHGVELLRHIEPIRSLRCFPDELAQVWTNLIHNALQAMAQKGVLTVRLSERDGCACVEIGDTGCGIAPDIRERIFEPFFTTKAAGEGSGLGLDIVKNIVAKHAGRIEVESVVGQGSLFRVLLPFDATRA